MRRSVTSGILLLAALSLAVTTSAGKAAAPKPTNIPVTVTIADGNAIQSDGGGPYENGANGVTAVIVPLGNLQLKTGIQRAFSLNFGGCAAGPCTPPFTSGLRQGYLTTSCDTALPAMGIGDQQFCNLNVHFTYDQQGWFVRFGQAYDTTPATVTRDGDGWTIEVLAGGIALLESYPLKGRATYTPHGYYDMPVGLTVTLLQ